MIKTRIFVLGLALCVSVAFSAQKDKNEFSDQTLGVKPIPANSEFKDVENVSNEFGEGEPKELVSKFIIKSVVDRLEKTTVFKNVSVCLEDQPCAKDAFLSFKNFRLSLVTKVKPIGFVREIQLKTDYVITNSQTESTIVSGYIDQEVHDNYTLTIDTWNELSDEITKDLIDKIDNPQSSGKKMPLVLTIVGSGLLMVVPVALLTYNEPFKTIAASAFGLGGCICIGITIPQWINYSKPNQ